MSTTVGSTTIRVLRWQAWELGSLARDLWRSRHWPGWWHLGWALTFGSEGLTGVLVFTVAATLLIVLLAYLVGGWLTLLAWSAACYAAVAWLTAVPRARHHVRRDIRFGAVSITHGLIDKRPNPDQRHRWQPRPRRVRFRRFTREFESCDLPLAQVWRQGNDEARMRLIDEEKSRLKPHGARYGATFTLEWDEDAPIPHIRRVAAIPRHIDAQHWAPPKGVILLGATGGDHPKAVMVDGQPFAGWSRKANPHMYFAGETGGGKTAGLRWLIRAMYDSAHASGHGLEIAGIDGKQGGNLAFLEGREGVIHPIADEPDEWLDVATKVDNEMSARYEQLRKWRRGQGPKPSWSTDIVLVVDEFIDIRESKDIGDRVLEKVGRIARLGREAGCTLVMSALRPDVVAALPGLVRAQLNARLLLGNVRDHVIGNMMFDGQWRDAYALSNPADEDIPGRGIARLGGHCYRVQIPWIPDPADNPAAAEEWLPPQLPENTTDLGERRRQRTRGGEPVEYIHPRERRRAADTETLEKA